MSVTNAEIIVCRDGDDLSRRAAEEFIRLAGHAVQSDGRFAVALSGGSTPKALYALLAAAPRAPRIDWPKVHLFWGDERCVPPDHPESNYRMVQEALLRHISIPPENIHRMAGEMEPRAAAAEYEKELGRFFQPAQDALPRFDLILLGLGDDGHTASLFPGSEALGEGKRWVVANYVEKLHAHRLTLTLPVVNAAAQVQFLVAGAGKAAIVNELLGSPAGATNYPASGVRPRAGRLAWMITADAAPK